VLYQPWAKGATNPLVPELPRISGSATVSIVRYVLKNYPSRYVFLAAKVRIRGRAALVR
jgi:hypothetical protein